MNIYNNNLKSSGVRRLIIPPSYYQPSLHLSYWTRGSIITSYLENLSLLLPITPSLFNSWISNSLLDNKLPPNNNHWYLSLWIRNSDRIQWGWLLSSPQCMGLDDWIIWRLFTPTFSGWFWVLTGDITGNAGTKPTCGLYMWLGLPYNIVAEFQEQVS